MAKRRERHTAFDTAHPAVPAAYVVITLGLTMCAVQPVLVGISLVGGLLYAGCVHGVRATLASLRWQLPIIVLIGLVNPLFSASGSTELMRIGGRAVYLESLCYGATMGALFVASALWFQAAAHLVPFDKVMALGANAAPVVSLMVSQCMRLIPRFVRQGRLVAAVQDAAIPGRVGTAGADGAAGAAVMPAGCDRPATAAGEPAASAGEFTADEGNVAARGVRNLCAHALPCDPSRARVQNGARARMAALRSALATRLRLSTVLMGWTLEDSLETANAMRARGWGAAPRRTSYVRYRFTMADAVALAALVIAGGCCAALVATAAGGFQFYPQMTPLAPWWGYAPYVAWVLLPSVLHAREARRFR